MMMKMQLNAITTKNSPPTHFQSQTASYCFKGVCSSRDLQCQLLWGDGASDADSDCYSHKNVLGSEQGNCGSSWPGDKTQAVFVKCLPRFEGIVGGRVGFGGWRKVEELRGWWGVVGFRNGWFVLGETCAMGG